MREGSVGWQAGGLQSGERPARALSLGSSPPPSAHARARRACGWRGRGGEGAGRSGWAGGGVPGGVGACRGVCGGVGAVACVAGLAAQTAGRRERSGAGQGWAAGRWGWRGSLAMHAPRALLSALLLACGFWGELPGCQQAALPPPPPPPGAAAHRAMHSRRDARKGPAAAATAGPPEPPEYMLALYRTAALAGAPPPAAATNASAARAANTVTSFVDRGRGKRPPGTPGPQPQPHARASPAAEALPPAQQLSCPGSPLARRPRAPPRSSPGRPGRGSGSSPKQTQSAPLPRRWGLAAAGEARLSTAP